jgi:ABC-type antimicrobial peptide transport system permease subunit
MLCVRATGDADALVAAIRREARSLDPNLPVFNVKTFAEQINESVSTERLVALLSSFFGFFALLLAALGLYGVMAYAVTRRTRELGIRIALGAQRRDVLRLVLKQGMKLAGLGVTLGLIVALGLTRLTKSLLFGVSATDPLTFLGTGLLLVSVALLACWIPARRATRVDPLKVLRHD